MRGEGWTCGAVYTEECIGRGSTHKNIDGWRECGVEGRLAVGCLMTCEGHIQVIT